MVEYLGTWKRRYGLLGDRPSVLRDILGVFSLIFQKWPQHLSSHGQNWSRRVHSNCIELDKRSMDEYLGTWKGLSGLLRSNQAVLGDICGLFTAVSQKWPQRMPPARPELVKKGPFQLHRT